MSQYRYFTIPESRTTADGVELEFVAGFILALLRDSRYGASAEAGRMRIYTEDAFEGASAGDVVKLRKEEADLLAAVAQAPNFGGPPHIPLGYDADRLNCLLRWGWIDLVVEAPEVDPRPQPRRPEDVAEAEPA